MASRSAMQGDASPSSALGAPGRLHYSQVIEAALTGVGAHSKLDEDLAYAAEVTRRAVTSLKAYEATVDYHHMAERDKMKALLTLNTVYALQEKVAATHARQRSVEQNAGEGDAGLESAYRSGGGNTAGGAGHTAAGGGGFGGVRFNASSASPTPSRARPTPLGTGTGASSDYGLVGTPRGGGGGGNMSYGIGNTSAVPHTTPGRSFLH